jgi:hypothetical protein
MELLLKRGDLKDIAEKHGFNYWTVRAVASGVRKDKAIQTAIEVKQSERVLQIVTKKLQPTGL